MQYRSKLTAICAALLMKYIEENEHISLYNQERVILRSCKLFLNNLDEFIKCFSAYKKVNCIFLINVFRLRDHEIVLNLS